MILVLAGTSDARELAIGIRSAGYEVLTTVVTESAAKSMDAEGLPVLIGRLTAEAMKQLIEERGIRIVADATHPFAEEASKNAMAAAELADVPYVRFERQSLSIEQGALVTTVEDYKQAAELAADKKGNIMLTTGSKTLKIFADRLVGLPDTRLIARMLPRQDNMEKCDELGIDQKNIVAMQGPFSKELNKALYAHYNVTLMITKESGKVGAVDEKLEAALEMGIPSIVIGRPSLAYGDYYSDFAGVIQYINERIQKET
ncbi:precorrin-6A reductase [Paenibacillus sp. N3.4]|uniref:precorrin-6A reductase n=1 Tax=Paenibacillus sp. N3.4 TaxID=2603222 RepID=UPI0011C88D6C|nr:precorrin-6A reductase [Paenibacillus sp. N3.4]TXK83517.1 precorrin-6A reductase [Paenibacillus sp. N3.4]